MDTKRVLAFDLGASSGRALIGKFNKNAIELTEVHRFSNGPVEIEGTLYWDISKLFNEIKLGIRKAAISGGFDSIGIDTWGVDFGLIDADGRLIENPVHYRDGRTDGMMEVAFQSVPKEKLYMLTGNQLMQINTIFQLLSLVKNRQGLLGRAAKLLFMPDLISYMLTADMKSEYTIASTSQMLEPYARQWNYELLEKLGIPSRLLCDIVMPGTVSGRLKDDICEELSISKVDVISVASHDTASALVAVPSNQENFVFISCGTWSLFGTELKSPVINDKTLMYNLTNEGCFGGRIRLLKNIMGLWLIQECKCQWNGEGSEVSFSQLEQEARKADAFKCFIDPDDILFVKPGDLPERIREFCKATDQYIPQTKGEIVRCIYESLALKHRETFEQIIDVSEMEYNRIFIVGGGVKDKLLCQLTANACNTEVVTGPVEATALGNIAVQLIAQREIQNVNEARVIIADSFPSNYYKPEGKEDWDKAYDRFKKIILRREVI